MADKNDQMKIGEILIRSGWITWDQLEKALQIQQQTGQHHIDRVLVKEGYVSRKEGQVLFLGEILIRNNWLNWDQLTEALKIQRETGLIVGEILLSRRFVTKQNLYRALAIQYGMVYLEFDKLQEISPAVIALIDKQIAYQYHALPILVKGDTLFIAIADPMDIKAEMEIGKIISKFRLQTTLVTPEDMDRALEHYYGPA